MTALANRFRNDSGIALRLLRNHQPEAAGNVECDNCGARWNEHSVGPDQPSGAVGVCPNVDETEGMFKDAVRAMEHQLIADSQ